MNAASIDQQVQPVRDEAGEVAQQLFADFLET